MLEHTVISRRSGPTLLAPRRMSREHLLATGNLAGGEFSPLAIKQRGTMFNIGRGAGYWIRVQILGSSGRACPQRQNDGVAQPALRWRTGLGINQVRGANNPLPLQ